MTFAISSVSTFETEIDVVLLKDSNCPRKDLPMGVIKHVFPGKDGRVCKIKLSIVRNGRVVTHIRPVTELVLLYIPRDLCRYTALVYELGIGLLCIIRFARIC